MPLGRPSDYGANLPWNRYSIAAHDGGEACVCDLTAAFALSGPTISHHLRVLREAGFYLDLLDAFAIAGFPKPSHRSPRTHVELLHERRPEMARAAAPLVDLFYEIRFGDRRLGVDSRRRAEAEAKQILEMAARDEGNVQ